VSKLRKLLLILVVPLPQPLKQALYRLLGWKIGRGVRIGLSYIDGQEVTLCDHVVIGHGNVFKQMKRLHIGADARLHNFNEIFGSSYGAEWAGELEIGNNVSFMSRHFIDASGSVVIGACAVIAGRETQFWSHQMSVVDGVSRLIPLRICIGEDAYIGARAMLLGCSVPAGAVVGAGSVVTRDFAAEDGKVLIAGNPATIKKRYEAKGEQTISEQKPEAKSDEKAKTKADKGEDKDAP
jgi:acetyltransferase-like isoleucine patch superfamily enzyme